MRYINLGGPVAVAALGAILFFAVEYDISGFQISTVGLILMVAAAIWFLAGVIIGASATKSETVVSKQTTGAATDGAAVEGGVAGNQEIRTETSSKGNNVVL